MGNTRIMTGEFNEVGQRERQTQNRIISLFCDELEYKYLGNWEDREDNQNLEEGLIREYLNRRRYSATLINKALYRLKEAANNYGESLYNKNKNVYQLLRYGIKVKPDIGENYETVHLIDWEKPKKNDFGIAEEVTVHGKRDKRPDIVLYVNGIAIGVLELKRSIVSIGEGIRQSIVNQHPDFIEDFFSTIQFIFAGNDTEGLRYGSIGTPEKYYLSWKEDEEDNSQIKLDKYLMKMCRKDRLIELMHDFVLFDGGIKKLPRVHQYFGVKAAQEHVHRKEGGIIWHTQGSGKSLVMVYLARWILEHNPHARVAIITDRDELDKQIERVYRDAGEPIYRTQSGRDLMRQLGKAKPRLLCSLVHKFGRQDIDDFSEFIKQLKSQPSPAVGELFLFVDECHRTQSGKLHKTMKALLPKAVFVGFTGTPLLKSDKKTSLEVFGTYIHTYKFNEGVEDQVVLDLVYEARDIDQVLTSPEKIDEWFETKTKGLNDFQKAELRKKWGTMQKVLSSRDRMGKVVCDIVHDFSVKPRLSSERGNAILVANSIYEACKYYELFQNTELKGKCALITSYDPVSKDIVTEDTGENTETEKEYKYNTYIKLLDGENTEKYEDKAKKLFIDSPSQMRLLIVVDKLLTGFDAPSCTYLYIDKSMQDHNLFQAICRVNRLDGEDKPFGYIVDYKDLFKAVENAVAVYTSELDYDEFEAEDCDILLQDRLKKGRERLDNAIEELALLCEPVEKPKTTVEYIKYFCGNTEIPEDLKSRELQRTALYKGIANLIRAYANIADEIKEAGYNENEIIEINKQLDFYLKLREEIRLASGETLDLKSYEADMRHLIDYYIQAQDPRKISCFDETPLLDLIVKSGIANVINQMPKGIRESKESVAETIENNVRRKIMQDHLINPAFFEAISFLLDEIIKERKNKAINYEEYLKKIAKLIETLKAGKDESTPATINTPAKQALYDNLGKNEQLALQIHKSILSNRPADWRGNRAKEQVIKGLLFEALNDGKEVDRIFSILKEQHEY